jgi:7,8-dihydropterin-6-yl-methyl-4-(beta-D-ribofuranosyl)aminobenzene 5'-phosphate synthase
MANERTVWLMVATVALVTGCASRTGSIATSPAAIVSSTAVPTKGVSKAAEAVTFTIVYDNVASGNSASGNSASGNSASGNDASAGDASDLALRTDWGFACLVETSGTIVLFDTGGKGEILLDNMAKLGFDSQEVDVVVLSHIHGDHTGGLMKLLETGVKPVVYVPASFPASFKDSVRALTDLVEVTDAMEILPGVYTTGEVRSSVVEQALVVETEKGLVVVTGCAHPGIVEMVRRAKEAVGDDVALVMGGFHLGGASEAQLDAIIADLRELGVQQVAPSHCTGDRAREVFAEAYGDDCTLSGVGHVFVIGETE